MRSEATQTLRAGCSKADPQTNTHTHKQTQTDRGDYNTLRSLARSVIINMFSQSNINNAAEIYISFRTNTSAANE